MSRNICAGAVFVLRSAWVHLGRCGCLEGVKSEAPAKQCRRNGLGNVEHEMGVKR